MYGDEDLVKPEFNVRTGAPTASTAQVGDEVDVSGNKMRVAGFDVKGRPSLELAPKPSAHIKPWWEVAKGFDPLMPADQYNALKRIYFDHFVAPQIPEGFSHSATWGEFDRATEREHLLTPAQRAEAPMLEASEGYIQGLLAPLKADPGGEKVYNFLDQMFKRAQTLREYEGVSHRGLRGAGEFTGSAVDLSLISHGIGAVEVLPQAADLTLTGRAAKLYDRVMRGSSTFAAYEAAVANNEDRGVAALEGAAIGAGFEVGATPLVRLLEKYQARNVDKILQRALSPGGEVEPELDAVLSKAVVKDVETAKKEGRSQLLHTDPQLKVPQVAVKTFKGEEVVIPIEPGQERNALNKINFHTQQGGEVVGISHAPEHVDAVNRFLRMQEKGVEGAYDQRVVKTTPGQANAVAEHANMEGVKGEPVGEDRVQVSTPRRPPTRDQVKEHLARNGAVEPELTNMTSMVQQLWNPQLPERSGKVMLEGLKAKLKPEALNAMLPEHWKLPEQSIQTLVAEKSPQALDVVKELGGDVEALKADTPQAKISRLYSLMDLPNWGDQYSRLRAEDLLVDLGHDPEALDLDLLSSAKSPAELENMLKSEEAAQLLEDEVQSKARGISAPGAMEEAARKGEFQPMARRPRVMYHGTSWEAAEKIKREGIKPGPPKEYVWQRGTFLTSSREDAATYGNYATNPKGTGMGERHAIVYTNTRNLGMVPDEAYLELEQEGTIGRVSKKTIPASRVEKIEYIDEQGNLVKTWTPERGEFQPSTFIRIPPTEQGEIGFTKGSDRPRLITERPHRIGVQVSKEEMEGLIPGGAAVTAFPVYEDTYQNIFNQLGITELNPADQRPLHIYTDVQSRSNVWHENAHVGLWNAGGAVDKSEGIWKAWYEGSRTPEGGIRPHLATANQISNALSTFKAYQTLDKWPMIEEAFVHSATAVRMGDVQTLAQLAAWDTSVRSVLDMVSEFGKQAVELSQSQLDTYAQRIFQRSMNNAVAKSSYEQLWEMRAHDALQDNIFYDPLRNEWSMINDAGEKSFLESAAVVDELDNMSGSAFAPSISLPLEMRGVRGPMVPRGSRPGKSLPLPEMGIPKEAGWTGLKAITGAFRPMLPWVADVDTKMNEFFSTKGQHFPIYDRVKAVDEALQQSDSWIINQKKTAAEFLKGNPQKLYDYMDALTVDEKYWPQMKDKLHLTDEDMGNIKKADSWLREFSADTHIPAFNYLRDQLPKLRGFNFNTERVYGGRAKEASDMSFFHQRIEEGSLNPQDAHLGRFINMLIREGAEKKFTGSAINDLKKLVDLKGKDGSYVLGSMRWPLANYVNYVRGIPDVTQQVIMRAAGDFQKGLATQFKRLNKYLPAGAQLPEEFNYPGNFVNRLMTLSYVGALGARPAIGLRDSMQALTTSLPVLGKRFMLGAEGTTVAGFEKARQAGALLEKTNIGELYGDIFNEMPAGGGALDKATKLANRLLAPSRWGHNVARSVAFNAEYNSTLDAVQRFRAGQIDPHTLLTDTSFWWYDQPAMNRLLGMAVDETIPAEEVAKKSGLELVDTTLWPYRRGAQPTILRTGLGRIFGQYGMWPMNYVDFLRRGITKFHQFPAQSLRTAATWVGSNYAAVAAMNAAGADVGKWFFVSPAGYGGGPSLELIQALAKTPEDTDEGRKARKTVAEYPLNFVPAFNEMKSVMKVMEDGGPMFNDDGSPSPNFLRVLGFKPLDELHQEHIENLSPEDWAEYQLGYKKVR